MKNLPWGRGKDSETVTQKEVLYLYENLIWI